VVEVREDSLNELKRLSLYRWRSLHTSDVGLSGITWKT
jgi:hypothetical protein